MEKISVIRDEVLGILDVNRGIAEPLINEVIQYANTDDEIKRFTSDFSRFRDRVSFENWRKKGRFIYTLTSNEKLLGLIWLGAEIMPSSNQFTESINTEEYGVTFAIRIYDIARGKHLARKFMGIVFKTFEESDEFKKLDRKGIWLETSIDNTSAVNAYTKFGFNIVTNPDKKNKILMVLQYYGTSYSIKN